MEEKNLLNKKEEFLQHSNDNNEYLIEKTKQSSV